MTDKLTQTTVPLPPHQLEFFYAQGMKFREMQEQARASALYVRGDDMRLIWVFEGDLLNLQLAGIAKEVS